MNLLMDNDPRFEIKKKSIDDYNRAYNMYCNRDWIGARDIFYDIFMKYGLGTSSVMANRCDRLIKNEPEGLLGRDLGFIKKIEVSRYDKKLKI